MNEDKRQALSAMVDSELPTQGCGKLLRELDRDIVLRREWERFHLIGEAMRRQLPNVQEGVLITRTQAALRDEPVMLRSPTRLAKSLRPAAGLALAASVAVVAVLGARMMHSQPVPNNEVASATVSLPAVVTASAPVIDPALRHTVASPVTAPDTSLAQWAGSSAGDRRWVNSPHGAQTQLNSYLLNHSEYANPVRGGMLPYVRIANDEHSN